MEPEDFEEGDNVGIMPGRLSGDLVFIDIDCVQALGEADRFLPPTGMEEGRLGKPRSHRGFRVKNIPKQMEATCANGIGGPRSWMFSRGPGDMVIEFKGTGSQVVVCPSVWTSKDGGRQEKREWHSFGEPAEVDYMELLDAVAKMAETFEGRNSRLESLRFPSKRLPRSKKTEAPELLALPSGEAARQARPYVARMAPAIEGRGGDRQTFTVACVLVIDFGLSQEEALPILLEYNLRCCPPWPVEALRHKLAMADRKEGPRGEKVRNPVYSVTVSLRPGDSEVVVGVDCAGPNRSYIDLSPSLYAGLVKDGRKRVLSPELAGIVWQGKQVLLALPSTIHANAREVWGEYFMARALREHGAAVQTLRWAFIGRRQTLREAEANGAEIEVAEPALYAWEAHAQAEEAKQRAKEADALRKALPRNKPSPKLTKAMGFVNKYGIGELNKQIVLKARRKGIKRSTLQNALYHVYNNNSSNT
jgi:hypothetical protein